MGQLQSEVGFVSSVDVNFPLHLPDLLIDQLLLRPLALQPLLVSLLLERLQSERVIFKRVRTRRKVYSVRYYLLSAVLELRKAALESASTWLDWFQRLQWLDGPAGAESLLGTSVTKFTLKPKGRQVLEVCQFLADR